MQTQKVMHPSYSIGPFTENKQAHSEIPDTFVIDFLIDYSRGQLPAAPCPLLFLSQQRPKGPPKLTGQCLCNRRCLIAPPRLKRSCYYTEAVHEWGMLVKEKTGSF
ncbi:hypothetical protein JTE90_027441 [Oedothorax gibbosus]|uniref:Uncharacterized protein n=1 Tax=Oedothorax gibbosus TaxID=931172 RepID=A0AAV6W276_9ARAC|nr:hypothetical protein JTE90_027441 [Oedothorax gibbosus]